MRLGDSVGALVGRGVSTSLGVAVGSLEGLNTIGTNVGLRVPLGFGLKALLDGLRVVGDLVGRSVGTPVGLLVELGVIVLGLPEG